MNRFHRVHVECAWSGGWFRGTGRWLFLFDCWVHVRNCVDIFPLDLSRLFCRRSGLPQRHLHLHYYAIQTALQTNGPTDPTSSAGPSAVVFVVAFAVLWIVSHLQYRTIWGGRQHYIPAAARSQNSWPICWTTILLHDLQIRCFLINKAERQDNTNDLYLRINLMWNRVTLLSLCIIW